MDQGLLPPSAPPAHVCAATAQGSLPTVAPPAQSQSHSSSYTRFTWRLLTPPPPPEQPMVPCPLSRPRIFWTTEMEDALIASLKESTREGLRPNGIFKKTAWVTARAAVQGETTTEITIKHCKSKIDTLKKDLRLWEALVSQPGFRIDERGCVTGDQAALAAYFQTYPTAVKFMDHPLRAADRLRDLFSMYPAAVVPEEVAAAEPVEQSASGASRRRRRRRSQSGSLPPRRRRTRATSDGPDVESQLSALSTLVGQLVRPLTDRLAEQSAGQRAEIAANRPPDYRREAMDRFMADYGHLHDEFKVTILSYLGEEQQARCFALYYSPEMRRVWLRRTIRREREAIFNDCFLSPEQFSRELAKV